MPFDPAVPDAPLEVRTHERGTVVATAALGTGHTGSLTGNDLEEQSSPKSSGHEPKHFVILTFRSLVIRADELRADELRAREGRSEQAHSWGDPVGMSGGLVKRETGARRRLWLRGSNEPRKPDFLGHLGRGNAMDPEFEFVIQWLADAKSMPRARAEDLFAAGKLFPNFDTADKSTRDLEKELDAAPRKFRTPEEHQRILSDLEVQGADKPPSIVDLEKELADTPRNFRTPEENQRILSDLEAKLIKVRLRECEFSCTLTLLILPPR